MNIQTRPLLIAAAAGAVVQTILGIISQAITVFTFDPAALLGVGGNFSTPSGAIGTIVCCVLLAMDVGVGFIYAFLSGKQGALTTGDGAIGGAASGAVARIASQVIGGCAGLLLTPLFIQQVTADLPPGQAEAFAAFSGAATIPALLISLCIFLISGVLFGALGGLIGTTLANRGQTAEEAV
jgi:hypothetical protein